MREGILVLFMAAGIVSIAYSQELVHYSFEESMLATQQTNQQFIVNSLNDNPLLEDYDVKF